MSAEVAVVGRGPVGLMLACELRLAGVEVVVLERLPEPRTESLGMAINPTVVELLTARGIMESLRGDGLEWPQAQFAHLPLDPTRLSERREYNFAVPQSMLEQRLEEHAVKLGARVLRGREVTGLTQDGDGVDVRVRTSGAAGAGEESLRFPYVVGCDGTDSTVRRLAGIAFPGTDAPFYGLTGDLVATDALFQHLGTNQYPGGLFTVAPSGPGTVRVSTGAFGVEAPDREAPVTVEELAANIKQLSGLEFAQLEPHWLARWFNVTRQAERYRKGRVFLAGDAAHVQFPLGGQALSTGLEDAVNLGWKLAAAVRGRAPDGLLDSYHTERHPVGERACRSTRAQTALMHPMEDVAPLRELMTELIGIPEVNERLVKLVGALDVRYPLEALGREAAADASADAADAPPHPLTGHRIGGVPLETADGSGSGSGSGSTTEALRTGRGVLIDLSGRGLRTAACAGWADRVDVITAGPTSRIGASALLLRPDGRVAWATDGSGDAGLRAALTRWFGPEQTDGAAAGDAHAQVGRG
ncbi:hypothetical protein DVA86_06945 [Streptomyces armeniacus]|uniref:FAD-binding domain-containing protein n=2 Tax=Streptomyces armeniacus TaxID=83291 RepID=A0A345XLB2_9ACTN|nr:FAD-dependent monooxygenase [Streptomyces armeniacus]AXK32428.1 hypothetical protein DVA86_06945 [Streptomyces armeniacus]